MDVADEAPTGSFDNNYELLIGAKKKAKTVIQQPQQSMLNMVLMNSTLDLDCNVITLPFDDVKVD